MLQVLSLPFCPMSQHIIETIKIVFQSDPSPESVICYTQAAAQDSLNEIMKSTDQLTLSMHDSNN